MTDATIIPFAVRGINAAKVGSATPRPRAASGLITRREECSLCTLTASVAVYREDRRVTYCGRCAMAKLGPTAVLEFYRILDSVDAAMQQREDT
jgi:hypothetical protein